MVLNKRSRFRCFLVVPFAMLVVSQPLVNAQLSAERTLDAEDCQIDVFHIKNLESNQCLSVQDSADTDGNTAVEIQLVAGACEDSNRRQQWIQQDTDFMVRSNYYMGSKCLFPSEHRYGSSRRMVLKDCDSGDQTKGAWQKYSDGTIRNTHYETACWYQDAAVLELHMCSHSRRTKFWTAYTSNEECRISGRSSKTDDDTKPSRWWHRKSIERRVDSLGRWGIYYYWLIYLAVELACIPALPLTVMAGTLFGAWKGFVLVLTAAAVAAACSFWFGRTLLRDCVTRRLEGYPNIAKMDRAVSREGFRVMFLIQISPIFPFALGNYFYGTTSIGFVPFWFGTVLGISPGTFLYVYSGHVGYDLLQKKTQLPWYVYLIILVLFLFFLHMISSVAGSIIQRLVDEEDEQAELEKHELLEYDEQTEPEVKAEVAKC